MAERNPRRDEEAGRTNEEDIIGTSNDEDFDEVDEFEEEDDDSEGVEDIEE